MNPIRAIRTVVGATQAQLAQRDGTSQPAIATYEAGTNGEWSPGGVWMTHVWFIDNPDGLFAEENPELA